MGTRTDWIGEHAHRIVTLDTDAPLDDLRPFGDMVGAAEVVALGTSSRLTHELSAVAHRLVRLLVEEHGFRSLALEGDDEASARLDAYVRTGEGDPVTLLAEARSFLRTEEILGLVRWLRARNERHPDDPVRVVHTPGAVPLKPSTPMAEIESTLAASTLRWYDETHHKIVYWGGVAHTSVRNTQHPTCGALLRERFGTRYASVGLTFHHAAENGGIPAPPDDFAEAVLGKAGLDAYFLYLHADAPGPVREWLDSPIRARLIGPRYDPDLFLDGGALADWFDVVAFVAETTPGRPMA